MRESEREGRQKGLAANPVHGQSWMSCIFFFQDDADITVAGLRHFTLLPFSRKHRPPFSFALIVFIAAQRPDILGAEGPKERSTKK